MRKAVYPGTFDPITLGHRDVIARAVGNLCDHLVIGVASSQAKQPLFTIDERIAMAQQEATQMGLSSVVEVMPFDGLLTQFVRKVDAQMIVRGLRAVSDFEYEFQMATANHKLDQSIETVFLMASEDQHFTASSVVREIALLGGDVSHFVSETIAKHITAKIMPLYSPIPSP